MTGAKPYTSPVVNKRNRGWHRSLPMPTKPLIVAYRAELKQQGCSLGKIIEVENGYATHYRLPVPSLH